MGVSGIHGVHSAAKAKRVSSVGPVGQADGDTAPEVVTRTLGPNHDTFQSDFSSLVKAVRGGDVSGAQSALNALQSDATAASATYSPASTSSTTQARGVSASQSDLDTLFQAVRSGDIAGAQAALGQLQLDVRSHGDHASRQGQIHGRGHWRGNGHHGSGLRADIVAAFQSPTATTPLVADNGQAPSTPAPIETLPVAV